jgi:hypothetical protein
MLIKSSRTVIAKLKAGQTLTRGCSGGWYLWRDGVRLNRVSGAAAEGAVESGEIARADDRSSVVGETYSAGRARQ